MLRVFALTLAFILMDATNREGPVGFVDLPHLLALHPLHGMLDDYDRAILALRRTQTISGLEDPAARAQNGAAAAQRESVAAQGRIERIPASDAGADPAWERSAFAEVLSSQHGADRSLNAYRSELARETEANLRGFAAGIAARNQRALAARRQQLLENELALGFDLARRDAAERLTLRVRLTNLYLDGAARAKLQAELSEIERHHGAAVAAMRRDNEAALAAYARQLQSQGTAADSAMSAQLRSKAAANLALRFRVLQAESNAVDALPNLPARLDWFASTYRFTTDAAAIIAGLRTARVDLSQRFAQIAAVDRTSRTQTNAQIEQLQKNRQELYRSMTAQIVRAAQELAAQRHLRGVSFSGSRPQGSVDLTGALATKLKLI
jgi:hypothetical protein